MPMKQRILRVELDLGGGQKVVLDERLWLHVRITKAAMAIQSRANIEVGGLSKQEREAVLTKFSARAKYLRDNGAPNLDINFVFVKVTAGYKIDGKDKTSIIFHGQVALSEISSPPPNMTIQITAFTNQIDRTNVSMVMPTNATLREYASFVAQQAGLRLEFDSVHGDDDSMNMGIQAATVQAMVVDLQNYNRQDIIAFVDDEVLYVLDRGKSSKTSNPFQISQFIGVPTWNEWGIDFRCMFDDRIKLAGAVIPMSKVNPAINQGTFIPMRIEYDLTSRSSQFGMKVSAYPSAG